MKRFNFLGIASNYLLIVIAAAALLALLWWAAGDDDAADFELDAIRAAPHPIKR